MRVKDQNWHIQVKTLEFQKFCTGEASLAILKESSRDSSFMSSQAGQVEYTLVRQIL